MEHKKIIKDLEEIRSSLWTGKDRFEHYNIGESRIMVSKDHIQISISLHSEVGYSSNYYVGLKFDIDFDHYDSFEDYIVDVYKTVEELKDE